jgi:uncharacterized protein YdhG (YjbR/CyaY superfamily)
MTANETTGQRPKPAAIDDYLATVPLEVRPIMEEIRQIIKTSVPAATETISYNMPAFRLDHVFIFFAAFKNHVGIFPPVDGNEDLARSLAPFRGEKGNLRFPLAQPIPYDLIGRVAEALAGQQANPER